ncbi:hypothetical protein [Schlesneria paludicola]|uniref:hypothetical protein n=1 Tax=Schlesneria paludicola TaxID=360056 RepID=UPI000299F218|nr:hypothetical protein [Schlesneria paludicola]
MAKKRPHEAEEVIAAEAPISHDIETEQQPDTDQPSSSSESLDPLMDEVQTFINLRDELARKLAAEIETMEQKLVELKKTAASLFPSGSNDAPEEKKTKKPKPKAPKEEKVSPATEPEHEAAE